MALTQYRWIGNHPREFTVGSGADATLPFLGPGDYIELDSTTVSGDEELKELMDEGLLLDVEAFTAEAEAAATAEAEATSESTKTTATKGGKA
jgi:hypothetical protein